MQPATEDARRAVAESFAGARAPAVMVDFDGTISEIVATPDAARPAAGAVEVLSRLAAGGVATTVVSSRPASFLLEVLHGLDPGVRLVGHSGLETVVDGRIEVDRAVAGWTDVVADARGQVERSLPDGVHLEDKGLSFTLHFRGRPEAGPAATELAATVAAGSGLSMKPGRMNVELRPPVAVDKGTAVRSLLTPALDWALFAGDDVVDLPGFEAVHQAALHGVAVVVASAEAPSGLLDAADVVVADPAELVGLLEHLRR
ncbi:MAG: trehalose-phosphatase [Actinomycetota bacterium]